MECIITFCDLCNIDQDPEKFQELPDQEGVLEPLGFFRGMFRGTFEQAEYQNNWIERDFGHMCDWCTDEEGKRLAREESEEAETLFVPLPVPETPAIVEKIPKKRGRKPKV